MAIPEIVQGDGHKKDVAIFWLTLALATVSVALTGLLIVFITGYIRNHRNYHGLQGSEKRSLSRFELPSPRKSKPPRSSVDRIDDEDVQREYMIRKSYASRASSRNETPSIRRSEDTVDMELQTPPLPQFTESVDEYQSQLQPQQSQPQPRQPVTHNERQNGLQAETSVNGSIFPITEEPPLSTHPLFATQSSPDLSQQRLVAPRPAVAHLPQGNPYYLARSGSRRSTASSRYEMA